MSKTREMLTVVHDIADELNEAIELLQLEILRSYMLDDKKTSVTHDDLMHANRITNMLKEVGHFYAFYKSLNNLDDNLPDFVERYESENERRKY